MSPTHSSRKPRLGKPSKPYPDFPLHAHAAGVWAKKIRGKLHYFGPWNDPDAALAKYLAEKDDLHAGRKPKPETPDAATVKELANRFLIAKQTLVDSDELSPRTWTDYKEVADLVVASFGKGRVLTDFGPDDFASLRNAAAKKWGPHKLGKTIQCVRCLFKFAYETELLDKPARFGPGFKRPSKKTMRLNRAEKGVKLFDRVELRAMIDGALVVGEQGPERVSASAPLRAMILLGINCGFGNSDCSQLPLSSVDLKDGWIDYPRPKTGIPRRNPLWPETVSALRDVLDARKEPAEDEVKPLLFVTKYGKPWGKDIADSPITKETRKLLDKLGINGHRNFYALRHTFRTVADGAKDQPAADFLMGHESTHMSSVYRERIEDDRLKGVADYVRNWLFGPKKENAEK